MKIIETIKKLIEKAQKTDSIQESETFMLKAQELLAKYNLDMSHVERLEIEEGITEAIQKFEEQWERDLMTGIGANNFCKVYGCPEGLRIIGNASNIEVTLFLYSFFRTRLSELSIPAYFRFLGEKSDLLGFKLEPTKKFKNQFLLDYYKGGVDGIKSKMNEKKIEMSKQEGMSGLIRLTGIEIEKYVNERYRVRTTSRRDSGSSSGVGYGRGFADGSSINVTRNKMIG